jgi:hypothetical protein
MKVASVYELHYSVCINEAITNIIEAWELDQFRRQVSTKVSELTLQSRDFEKLMSLSARNATYIYIFFFWNPKFSYCDAKRMPPYLGWLNPLHMKFI